MVEVTAILLFGDDEDVLGTAINQVGSNLLSQGMDFEIICVGTRSCDNSHAIAALLRKDWPQMRVIAGRDPRRAVHEAMLLARGKWVWASTASSALGDIATFSRMWRIAQEKRATLVVERPSAFLGRRLHLLEHSDTIRGDLPAVAAKLVRRCQSERQVVAGSYRPRRRRFSTMVPQLVRALDR